MRMFSRIGRWEGAWSLMKRRVFWCSEVWCSGVWGAYWALTGVEQDGQVLPRREQRCKIGETFLFFFLAAGVLLLPSR